MKRSELPVPAFIVAFFLVVTLLAGVSAFTLWNELRTNERTDDLVESSLERARLIGVMRADAATLEKDVNDHINAQDEDDRREADNAISNVLDELKKISANYTVNLPPGEAEIWNRLNETSQKMARSVRTTVKYANRKEAERARQHLDDLVVPISNELDDIANELARKNAEETRQLLRQIEQLRLRTTILSSTVVGIAVLFSVIIAFQVTRTLRRQGNTISEQLVELGRRNSELDSFASRVAHDLVAPLSPLKGYLTLSRRKVADPEIKELLAQAESSTSRMSELVDALLRFCRAGKPSDAAADLDTAVTTILLEASQAADAAHVVLDRHIEKEVRVACAPQLLQSIAQNIVSNAVKYTAGTAAAHVSVRVAREGSMGVLEVKDNGRGMSPHSLQNLYQPFFRGTEAPTLPGTGLGLATTKRLVDAHGGTIEIQSAEGRGTSVRVQLPLAKVTDPAPTAAPRQVNA